MLGCVDLGGRRIIKKNFFQAEDGIRDLFRGLVGSEMCIRDRGSSPVEERRALIPPRLCVDDEDDDDDADCVELRGKNWGELAPPPSVRL